MVHRDYEKFKFTIKHTFLTILTNFYLMDKFIIRNTSASGTSQPVSSGSSVQNKKTSGNRSFSTDFIKFGFRRYENNKMVQPQCVVCGEILTNES